MIDSPRMFKEATEEKFNLNELIAWVEENPLDEDRIYEIESILQTGVIPLLRKAINNFENYTVINFTKLTQEDLQKSKSKIEKAIGLIEEKIGYYCRANVYYIEFRLSQTLDQIIHNAFKLKSQEKLDLRGITLDLPKSEVIYILIYLMVLYKSFESDLNTAVGDLNSIQDDIKLQIRNFTDNYPLSLFKKGFRYKLQSFLNQSYKFNNPESSGIMTKVGAYLQMGSFSDADDKLNHEIDFKLETLLYSSVVVITLWATILSLFESKNHQFIVLLFAIFITFYIVVDNDLLQPAMVRKKYLLTTIAYCEAKNSLLPTLSQSIKSVDLQQCLDHIHNSPRINFFKPK